MERLHPDPRFSNTALIAGRLRVADEVPAAGVAARFVAVPTAAGASSGMLNLARVTGEQMIRGGAHRGKVAGLHTMSVPCVDVISWLADHFKVTDYVIITWI